MSKDRSVLLLSLKPRFAASILDGTKTVELRRVAPKVQPGHMVLIYASSPVRQLAGKCRVVRLDVAPKSVIWERYRNQCGVTEAEYEAYFEGAQNAVAIVVDSPCTLQEPPSLATLRNRVAGFRPPQSFRYLSTSMLEQLEITAVDLRQTRTASTSPWPTDSAPDT